jgi:hypothetical protein
MNIETVPARDDDLAVVRNLFALYVHDISEFGRWDVNRRPSSAFQRELQTTGTGHWP